MEWLIGAFLAAAGAIINIGVNKYNNDMAKEEAEKQRDWNAEQIKQTNAEQIALANTEHTREVADLRASGLSAYASTSGASTPDLTAPQSNIDYEELARMKTEGYSNAISGAQSELAQAWSHDIAQQQVNNEVEKTKVQKEYNQAKTKIDELRYGIEKQYLDIDRQKTDIQNDKTLTETERMRKLLDYDFKSAMLKNTAQTIQNEQNQWLFDNMKDNEEYYRALPKVEFNLKSAELSYILAQKSNIIADNVRSEYKDYDWHNLTEAQTKKIMKDMKLDEKKFKWQQVSDVLKLGAHIFGSNGKKSSSFFNLPF